MGKRWNDFWFGALYSPVTLALLRIALCLILLSHVTGSAGPGSPFWRGPEASYFANGFYSPYVQWLLPPPYVVFIWVSRLCVVFTAMALFGVWTSLSLFMAAGLACYQFFLSRFFYTNNLYSLMLGVFLCGFMPCGKALSVDAWMDRRRGQQPPEVVVSWAARLLQVLVSLIYLGSATSKLTPAWLSGDLVETFYTYGGMSATGWLGFIERIPFAWQARAAVATEYCLAVGLWVPRWRWLVLTIGIGFHIFMDVTMSISAFSWQMSAFYLVFLPRFERATGSAKLPGGSLSD